MNVWDAKSIEQHDYLVRRIKLCGFTDTHVGLILTRFSKHGQPLSLGAVASWKARRVMWAPERIALLQEACNRIAKGEKVLEVVESYSGSVKAQAHATVNRPLPSGSDAGPTPMPSTVAEADALLGPPAELDDPLQASLAPHARTILAGVLWMANNAKTEGVRMKALLQLGEWLYGRPLQQIRVERDHSTVEDAELLTTLYYQQKAILLAKIATAPDPTVIEGEVRAVLPSLEDQEMRSEVEEALQKRLVEAVAPEFEVGSSDHSKSN